MQLDGNDERRQHPRFKLAAKVEFHHEPTNRDFPAKSVNLSAGGMMMYLPATVPVQKGQSVDIAVGSVENPAFADLEESISGTITRVDRQHLLSTGNIAVGVKFND